MRDHLTTADTVPPGAAAWPGLAELGRDLAARQVSAVELVDCCLNRVAALDPLVHAVVAVDETAGAQARESDRRRAAGMSRPLEGIPVLVKDNIDTAGLSSTAGSMLLAGRPPDTDAGVVRLLRAAGAVLVAKTNLSEWGNFRTTCGSEGWSSVGGQTRNPHALDRTPWGSSSGSAAAVAASMAPVAIGTETDGSIVCPAAACGVVGFKPALGELPTGGIVPISRVQDTPGVLAGSVADAALMYSVLTGAAPPAAVSLTGRRLGLWPGRKTSTAVRDEFNTLASVLSDAGAEVVRIELPFDVQVFQDGLDAMIAEFEPSLSTYLRGRHGAPADLAAVLAANRADPQALTVFGQELLEFAAGIGEPERAAAGRRRSESRCWAQQALDDALSRDRLDCVVAPTGPPAWRIDHAAGDPPVATTSTIPALAGRPNISVPVGRIGLLPIGVSVFGPACADAVLALAAVIESACGPRPLPTFTAVS